MHAQQVRKRWVILGMLIGFTFLGHFNRGSMAVAGSERFIGPDRLSEAEMGRVYSVFLLVYAIGMLPGGWLLDRLGPRWALAFMGIGLGTCTAITGMLGWSGLAIAAMLVPLLLIRGIAGASSIALHPGAARSVSLWFPLEARSTANGLVTAGALLGIAFTFWGFGWLMDRFDWPMAFVISGGALTTLGIVWWLFSADAPGNQGASARSRATLGDVLDLFRNRSLILLTLSYGALGYVQYLYFYWIEYFFKTEMKLTSIESRWAATYVTLAMAVGMACGGWATDRLCRMVGHRAGSRAMGVLGMLLSAVFSLIGISVNDPTTVTWCFSLALGSLGLCEGLFWTTAATVEPRSPGLACALVNTGGNGVGMLAPAFTPIIKEHFGWSAAIVVASVVCAVGGAMWFGIRVANENHRE